MKDKTILGICALMIVGIIGIGLASAHSSGNYGMMGGYMMIDDYSNDMHEDVDNVLESGTYSDLEALREKYQMPMMHWVASEKDFDLARQMHDRFESSSNGMMGYDSIPCHRWN